MDLMAITSKAFLEGTVIPDKFTCNGLNFSPPLSWRNPPYGTRSFALICDDPDAPMGTFVHWVLYNLPATFSELQEGIAQGQQVPGIGSQGINDFKHFGYDGPCPPPGKLHHYYFTLFALDGSLLFPAGLNSMQLNKRMEEHLLGKAKLMGTFKR